MVPHDLRFIVLGEDHTHINFVRRWLQAEGVPLRQIRARAVAADATGSAGEQYVRQSYSAEVAYYRSQANHQRVTLIIVIDADTGSVGERRQQLDQTIDPPRRQAQERIALLVPRRNIETWLKVLLSSESPPFDEVTDFSREFSRGAPEECRVAGKAFAAFMQREGKESDLPSLAGTQGDAIPSDAVPYLAAGHEALLHWRARLDELAATGLRRVGLVWAGRASHPFDFARSASLA